jgi:hypothetical protein
MVPTLTCGFVLLKTSLAICGLLRVPAVGVRDRSANRRSGA